MATGRGRGGAKPLPMVQGKVGFRSKCPGSTRPEAKRLGGLVYGERARSSQDTRIRQPTVAVLVTWNMIFFYTERGCAI